MKVNVNKVTVLLLLLSVTVSMFARALPQSRIAYADSPSEQIVNGGFEWGNVSAWDTWTYFDWNINTTSPCNDTYCASGDSNAEIRQVFAEPVNVSSITSFGFWIKGNSSVPEGLRVTIELYGLAPAVNFHSPVGSGYTYVNLTADIPEGTEAIVSIDFMLTDFDYRDYEYVWQDYGATFIDSVSLIGIAAVGLPSLNEQILNPNFEDYTMNFSEPVFANWTQEGCSLSYYEGRTGSGYAWGYSMPEWTLQEFATPIDGGTITRFGFWGKWGGYTGDLYFDSVTLWDTHGVAYSKSGILMHELGWYYYDCMDLINASEAYVQLRIYHHNSYFWAMWDDVTLLGDPVASYTVDVSSHPEIFGDFEHNGTLTSSPDSLGYYHDYPDQTANLTAVDLTKSYGGYLYTFEGWNYTATLNGSSSNLVTNPSFETPRTYSERINNGGFETGDFAGWTLLAGNPSVSSYTTHSGEYKLDFKDNYSGLILGVVSQTFPAILGSEISSFTFWYLTYTNCKICATIGYTDGTIDTTGNLTHDATYIQVDLKEYLDVQKSVQNITFNQVDLFAFSNSYIDDVSLVALDVESGWMFSRGEGSSYISRNPNAYSVLPNIFNASFYVDSFSQGLGGRVLFFYVGYVAYVSPSAYLVQNLTGLYVEIIIGQYPEYDIITQITYDSWHNITFLTRGGYYATEFSVELDGVELLSSSENDVYGTYSEFDVGVIEAGGATYQLFIDDVTWTTMGSGIFTDDFESGLPNGWDIYGSAKLSSAEYVSSSHSVEMLPSNATWLTEDQAHDGTHSVVLDFGGASVSQVLNESVPVTSVNELSFWYYVASYDALQYGGFQVVYDDDSGNYFDLVSLPNASVGSWVQEDVHTYLDPARNITKIICWNDNEVSYDVYFDEVCLTTMEPFEGYNFTTDPTILLTMDSDRIAIMEYSSSEQFSLDVLAVPVAVGSMPFTLNGTSYLTAYSETLTQATYVLTATTLSLPMNSSWKYLFDHWLLNSSVIYYSQSVTFTSTADTNFTMVYVASQIIPTMPIVGHDALNMTLYFRSDVWTVHTTLGYKLQTEDTMTPTSDTLTNMGSLTSVTYGFKVYVIDFWNSTTELTGESQALMTVSGNVSGMQTAYWLCPAWSGMVDSLEVKVFVSFDEGASWTLRMISITKTEMLITFPEATWTFHLWVNSTQTSDTIATMKWGSYNIYYSSIDLQYYKADPWQVAQYRLYQLDLLAWMFTPWTYWIGDLFWAIALFFCCVTNIIWTGSLKPVLAWLWIFGGTGSLLWALVPPLALHVAVLMLVAAMAFTLFKVIYGKRV